jgi:hypothetical protein
MSKRSLRSAFFVAAALTLSPHSGKAAEPGACLDKNQINDILANEGQSKIISAVQAPWAVEGKLVGNFMDVIFTSDAAGKTGYQLTEDGCKPTDVSTDAAPVGVKVVSLRDIHLYDESGDVPIEAKMEANPEVALKECSTILAALAKQGRQTVCGVHDKVLEAQEADGLHVILQAKASSKAGIIGSTLVTVSRDPKDGSGEFMWTTPRGAMFRAGDFTSITPVITPKNTP